MCEIKKPVETLKEAINNNPLFSEAIKNYLEIAEKIMSLSLESKEALSELLDGLIEIDIENTPYEPDHHDEHRATEIRILIGR